MPQFLFKHPEKTKTGLKVSVNHPVLILNGLFFLFSFVMAYLFYHGTLSAGDAVYTFSMRGGDYGDNPIQLMQHWYLFINGRVTQALFAAILMIPSFFSPFPEAYPWWLISGLEIFCVLTAPINMVLFFRRFLKMRWRFCFLFLVFFWSTWSLNDIIYAPAHMHQSVEGYYLPVYLTSLAFLWLGNSKNYLPRKRFYFVFTFLYFLLSLVGEQFIPSIPVLFLVILWMNDYFQNNRKRLYIFLYAIILTAISAIIFFAAPGQHIRSSNVNASIGLTTFSFDHLQNWLITAASYGYDALFHWDANLPAHLNLNAFLFDWTPNFDVLGMFSLFLLFPLILGFLDIVRLFRKYRTTRGFFDWKFSAEPVLKTAVLSLAFHVSYLLIMSTLLISDYFPLYAIIFPSYLLISGLLLDLYLLLLVVQSYSEKKISVGNDTVGMETVKKSVRGVKLDKTVAIISVLMSLFLSLGIAPEILSRISGYYKPQTLLLTTGILWGLCSGIFYLILIHLSIPQVKTIRFTWNGVMILLSAGLAWYLWSSFCPKVPMPSVWYDLSITATGEKNPSSGGDEIWLRQITYGDDFDLSLDQFDGQENWREIDDYLVYSGTEPSVLSTRFRTRAGEKIDLLFSEHSASGIVDVEINGKTVQVDLYAPGEGGDHLEVIQVPDDWWQKLLSFANWFVIFIFLYFWMSWLFQHPTNCKENWLQKASIVTAGFFLVIIVALPNVQDIIRCYQVFDYTQEVRHLTYEKIADITVSSTDEDTFYLINCPKKSYYNHYGFDSPWGIDSNLLWRGLDRVTLLVDQDASLSELDSNLNYLVIECEYPNE